MFPAKRPTPTAHDGPLRWLVPSTSKPGESHLVQLDAFGTNGRCTCPDFTCRHEPNLRANPTIGGVDKTRCKHIRLVRSHFLDSVISELARQAKVVLIFACAAAGAAPSPAFLDALAYAETRNRSIDGDGGDALGPFQFHRSAWADADALRAKRKQPRQTYDLGAPCHHWSLVYAETLVGWYEARLRQRRIEPTAARLWLCWTMGFAGAERIGFDIRRAPAVKRRGFARLSERLGTNKPTCE